MGEAAHAARQMAVPNELSTVKDTERSLMAATNINRVVMTGNLTSDPELRTLPSGTAVCDMRIACNTRRKDQDSGDWVDKPNYFNITAWGPQAETAARYLSKGRPVAIDGRLEWREWESQDGTKRQAVSIIADSVQFLGSRGEGSSAEPVPSPDEDLQPVAVGADGGDDERPF